MIFCVVKQCAGVEFLSTPNFFKFCCCFIYCGKTWCVAQTQASEQKLQQVLDFVCGQLNCKEIQPGGFCFNPDTVRNHASYAIDLNFQINGVCDFSYATHSITDPSYGECVYP
ncbi:hypothetical protein L1887_19667 [Cichorium endivia]|nr:hypothetical protein L1887_19667 [Cichorium endivia]